MIDQQNRWFNSGGFLQRPLGSTVQRLAALTLSLTLVTAPALAETPKDADAPAKPAAAKTSADVAEEVDELREELQTLKEALAKRDKQLDDAQKMAAEANARAAAAVAKSAEVNQNPAPQEQKPATVAVNSKPEVNPPVPAPAPQGEKHHEEGPATIHFKGVGITPAGFLAGETVNRTHATGGDIATPFTGIPFNGNSLNDVSEFAFSGRQSRLSMLVEGKIANATLDGYVEADFLGAGTTSNNRQTNSYVFRQRQLYAMASFTNGWSITGGQQWSLAAENKHGITNRYAGGIGESLPNMIDPNYVVGLTWARADAVRVAKNFDKAAFAFSIEGPQTTIGGRGFSTTTNTSALGVVTTSQNFWVNSPGAAAGLYNAFDATGYTANKLPDFVLKAAFDPGFGHYEVLGIISTFRDRIYPCAVVSPTASSTDGTVILKGSPINPAGCVSATTGAILTAPSATGAYNDSRTGGGVGVSAALPLVPKKFDLGIKVVGGDGIGRFGAAQLSDVTARPDGTLALIRNEQTLLKLEWHATPKVDVYAYFGNEYAGRTQYTGYRTVKVANTPAIPAFGTQPAYPSIATYTTSTSGIGGYGNILANNSGCATEAAPSGTGTPGTGGTCAGDIRNIMEGTIGFWHRLHSGPEGRFQWGLQYSYLEKFAWSGGGDVTAGAPGIAPKGIDNLFFTSIRYYIP